jgi:hypothetical protein
MSRESVRTSVLGREGIEGKEADEVAHDISSAGKQVRAPTPCGDPMRAFARGQRGEKEDQRAAVWMLRVDT